MKYKSRNTWLGTIMKIIKAFPLLLIILCFGCGETITKYIELTYTPQENVIRFEEAGNIAVKVKVNDLRFEASGNVVSKTIYGSNTAIVIAKNDLNELITHAIENELIIRGFKSGKKVLIDLTLFRLYGSVRNKPWERAMVFAVMFFRVDVKNPDGILVFSKKIVGRGEAPAGLGGIETVRESDKVALEAALKTGISHMVNDPEFIMALIKANAVGWVFKPYRSEEEFEYEEVTTEKLQCVSEVVICVQECSERLGKNSGKDNLEKAACRFDCDESLKVCFESLKRNEETSRRQW